ncbi:hypothetical protein [Arthrobacter sp. B0490]|uniref:hypothetical protein n=1 Tax=Arthrobacter sp. B0490 TaxID=2058891 RepID=UPI000CE539B0|nr:hypothetical protein [Arthrobacter sp. B0490]
MEHHAKESETHYWLSQALLARRRDHQDLVVAHQAARYALSLSADADAFARAAQTASLLDDDHEAPALLAAGLARFPLDRDLLLLSERIKGGDTVVGSQEKLVGGILQQSPLDAPAEADLASSPLRWVRTHLFYLWYHVRGVALLAVVLLPVPVLLAVALLAGGMHAALVVLSYRRLKAVFPAGYLREQRMDPVRGRNSAVALAAAAVLVPGGTVLAALHRDLGPGDGILVPPAVVPAGGTALGPAGAGPPGRRRAFGEPPAAELPPHPLRGRRVVPAELHAGRARRDRPRSVHGEHRGRCHRGGGHAVRRDPVGIKTLDLVVHSRAVAGGDSPWVTGAALSRPGRGRQAVRRRLLGARFLLVTLLVTCFTCRLGFGIFIGGFIESS